MTDKPESNTRRMIRLMGFDRMPVIYSGAIIIGDLEDDRRTDAEKEQAREVAAEWWRNAITAVEPQVKK